MDNVSVSLDDIDALARALDSGTVPAQDLLRAFVAAIRAVSGDEESVSVSVEVIGSLQDTFDAAFTPYPAEEGHASGQHLHVLMKITR
jgi:hypothetical protein